MRHAGGALWCWLAVRGQRCSRTPSRPLAALLACPPTHSSGALAAWLQGLDKFLRAASSDPDTVLHYEFMQVGWLCSCEGD